MPNGLREPATEEAGGVGRVISTGVFAATPRFHDGAYLKPDEIPAIL
jgi:hypothetical protein